MMHSKGLLFLVGACTWGATQTPEEIAALRAARERIIGPAIAVGAEFTAHTPQAVGAGGVFRCGAAAPALSNEDFNARLSALRAKAKAERDAIMNEKLALMRARSARPPMPLEEYRERLKVLGEREAAVTQAAYDEDKTLQAEARVGQLQTDKRLALTLQHAPKDERATIVPLAGALPAPAFVAELNRVLRPFLATCGERSPVTVSHVYRDAFPVGGVDEERRYEKPIVAYVYTLRGGVLTLDPSGNTERWLAVNGPREAAPITLAAARAKLELVYTESARASALYRKDFEDASKRQAGIVYKLDPYWKQFEGDPALDSIRRVFDGDFVGQKESWQFKAAFYLFGEMYSVKCKAQVPKFERYLVPWSEVARTRTYLDGHVENEYRTRMQEVFIDARFAPQWPGWRPAAFKLIFVSAGEITEEMGSLATASNAKILEAIRKSGKMFMLPAFLGKHTCVSPVTVQLRENLVRAANGRPSVHAEKMVLPGAERESDAPLRGGGRRR